MFTIGRNNFGTLVFSGRITMCDMKIVYSTCLDEHGNKVAKPYQCLTLADAVKGYKRKDNCYTLFIDAVKANEVMKKLVAEGNVIIEQQIMAVA